MRARTKYSADKLIANAVPTWQNNLHCFRLFAFPQRLHAFLLPCASCTRLIGSDSRQIYFRLHKICKSIKTMVKIGTVTLISLRGVGLRSMQSHIQTFSCASMNGAQSLRPCRFRLLSVCVLLPGDGGEATADLITDLCSVARRYLWQEVDQSTRKETNQKFRPKDISLTRQHCFQGDKQNLSWSVGC